MARSSHLPAPPLRARTRLDTWFEALPELLAAATCAVALVQPDWPGYDLLRTAGLLFFVQLPLALITLFAGVLRIEDRAMGRSTKSAFLVIPTLIFALVTLLMLGPQGLLAVAWLSAANVYRLVTGAAPRTATVPGFWMTFEQGDGDSGVATSGISIKARGGDGKGRTWKVQGGVEQFDTGVTITLWMVVAALVYFLPLSSSAATEAYGTRIGWDLTAVGAIVAPAKALWAGTILFALRTLSKLDLLAAPAAPAARIEDDEVLEEIVSSVERKQQ
jgi:hypothetical protein